MHMFSGQSAHPQGNGAYVFAQNGDRSIVVQVCHKPRSGSQVSVNSAVAIKFKGATLKNIGGSWSGVPQDVTCSQTTCTFPDGEVVSRSGYGVYVRFPSSYCGTVSGMCGHYEPNTGFGDAYTSSSGSLVDVSPASGQRQNWGGPFWGQYQSQFVESFRATHETTLFTASECSTAPSSPPAVIKEPFADCPALQADAIRDCPDGPRYNDCLMDVGETCDLTTWVRDAQQNPPTDFVTQPPTKVPTAVAPPAPTPAPCAFDSCAAMATCASNMRCSSGGDPHVTMFSGKRSHPHGAGPFVLAQSADKSFVVQACHQPVGSSGSVSVNKALAIKTAQGVVKYVDGNWDVGNTGITCPSGVCTFPSGEKVAAVGSSVWVEFPAAYCNKVSGLCGTFNPATNFADTFTNAHGKITSFTGRREWGSFQADFVQSFAARGASSLFSASECPQPGANQPPLKPTPPFAECPLLEAVAKAKCPQGRHYADCVSDVGATCDLHWVHPIAPPGDLGERPTPPPTPAAANCAAGSFFNGSSCTACPAGQFQARAGQYGCEYCAPGTKPSADATTCNVCGVAPTCITDAHGHTVVQYHSDIHLSYKCHNTGTDCTCTAHPTHHAGHCMQFTHHNGFTHNFKGDCTASGQGVAVCE